MGKQTTENPFSFTGCWELKEMLGRTARDERQLLETIEEIPLDSVYYHTHSFFLRHQYIAGPYPNDFATWAAIQVRGSSSGRKVRASLIPSIMKTWIPCGRKLSPSSTIISPGWQIIPRTIFGEPFYFMQSRIIESPYRSGGQDPDRISRNFVHSGFQCGLLPHLRGHVAPWTAERGFSRSGSKNNWAELSWPRPLSKLDLYMSNLDSIRQQIINICDAVLGRGAKNEPS